MKAFSSPSRMLVFVLAGLLVSSTIHVPVLRAQSVGGKTRALDPGARRIVRPALDQMLALSPIPRRIIPQAAAFRIVVVRGDGAVNNISQRTAGEPIVEIRDENDNPVGGAAVTFLLPDAGPGATFANGESTLTVVTDANGQATGTGLTPNTTQGEFQIQVSATVEEQTLTTAITQTNTLTGVLAGAGISTKMILILAAIGGAAAAGTAVALSGGGNGGTPPGPGPVPVVFQTGTPTVGAPPQ